MALQLGLPQIDLELGREVRDSMFLSTVRDGMAGKHTGLEIGLEMVRKLGGVQQSRYYLIGAHSGVGKTQFVDFTFVFALWLTAKAENRSLKILYYSLELPSVVKKAKWCSMYIFWKYGVMMSTDFVLGRLRDRLPTDEEFARIEEAYRFVELMLQDMVLIDHYVTPSTVYKTITDRYYPNYGVVTREKLTDDQRAEGQVPLAIKFEPTKPVPLTLLIIDHLALLEGDNQKSTMDEMSKYAVNLRNMFGLTPVFIQQFNQDLFKSRREAVSRLGPGKVVSVMAPKQLDFGDSTYTYRDADHVLGLVKPADFEVEFFEGIPCTLPRFGGLGSACLVSYLIKNRYGPNNKITPLFMNGITGMFYDLPLSSGIPGLDLGTDWETWSAEALKIDKHHG